MYLNYPELTVREVTDLSENHKPLDTVAGQTSDKNTNLQKCVKIINGL